MKEQEFSLLEYDWNVDYSRNVIKLTPRQQTATEWTAEVLEHCNYDHEICISSVGRYVYVCDNAGQMAKACCSVTDTFNKDIGMAIAYARLRHFPIHPAFKPQTTPKQKLITLRDSREVKQGSRVYFKPVDLWGTVTVTKPAESTMLTVRWDGYEFDRRVPQNTVSLAITGES